MKEAGYRHKGGTTSGAARKKIKVVYGHFAANAPSFKFRIKTF